MATPEVTNIDQTGQQAGGAAGIFHRGQDSSKTKVWNFSRTFQHYADNDPNFPGLEINTANKTATFSEAWQWIPYQNLRASITPREWKTIGACSRLIRVRKLGFQVHNMQTISQEVATQSGKATITNQFVSQPFVMYGVDSDRLTYDMVTTSPDQDTKDRNKVNGELMECWPASYAEGKLKPIKWNLGKQFVQSLFNGTTQKENTTARGTVNTLNGFMNVSFHSNGMFSHTWHAHADALDRWYAVGAYLSVPNADGSDHAEYPISPELSADKEIGVIESNCATDVNRNYQGGPEPVYMKIVPIHHMVAPVNVNASFFITYFSEVETMMQPTAAFLTVNNGNVIPGSKLNPYKLTNQPVWNWNRERDIYRWQVGYSYKQPNTSKSCL